MDKIPCSVLIHTYMCVCNGFSHPACSAHPARQASRFLLSEGSQSITVACICRAPLWPQWRSMHLKRLHLFLPGTLTHVGQFAASVAFQDTHEKWILAPNPHEGESMVSTKGNVWCMFPFVFSTRAQTGSSPALLGIFTWDWPRFNPSLLLL